MNQRRHSGYIAFAIHRLSGLCLALFLPIHLYLLSLLLDNPQRFDDFLNWTSTPWVKLSETLLIVLAAAHLAGGIRILIIEWFAVPHHHARLIAGVALAGIVTGLVFLTAVAL